MPMGFFWDVDNFISKMYCLAGILILNNMPPEIALPRVVPQRHISRPKQWYPVLSLKCWLKANFIGQASLLLTKHVLSSLQSSSFIKHFSSTILSGLRYIKPTFFGLHLRLEADAVTGGISRTVNPTDILKLLTSGHNLSMSSLLYVASGGFRGKSQLLDSWSKHFIVRSKNSFIPTIDYLLPEREIRAAVEFDVLREANKFVGHGCSSMSTILTQVRCFFWPHS